ncbi:UMTA methyltransferase [Cordyceps javanica]|uniref:UMTA methyltransferase n=1 Tax=Cordyceps javanica TaxID=43265 RepID=A0A545UZA7_9HYPO|nr:UMTA methyltransferase [Cordyceps javanica]TQW06656.1 UMTA methyltransferase [Cordyceps javanica]
MSFPESTVPLDEEYRDTLEYCGRIFHRYSLETGTYFAPVDEEEVERLELMHDVLLKVFDNRLIFPPIVSPRNVLDCGCGAANWAVDVAEQYPDCEVLGIDVSPHMLPDHPPPNLDFQIDDLNARFTFPANSFDLVHSQMVAGGVHASRWPSYVRDMYRVTKHGGWCQIVEMYLNAQSDNGRLTYGKFLESRKNPRAALHMATWMESAGFVDIESKLITLPMSAWPTEPRDQRIGRANRENIKELLATAGLYPLTEQARMPMEEFEQLISSARDEAGDPALKAYFPLYVFIGRKPLRGMQ